MVERGFENFSTNHVANAVGFRVGTVYRYFARKDNILRHLYDEWLDNEDERHLIPTCNQNPPKQDCQLGAGCITQI
ncbi:TetR/AcrR family transcriptional regulator [Ruegeria arenilitoris]|uniref:TetR/AcrR family transcriptional regulator n=1 Tax=Ruegeria arenilitoris TaxID=1173585 RepID=UPI003464A3CC